MGYTGAGRAFRARAAPMDDTLKESALAHLPLFPLPNCVVFPGTLLPLHVFEPRYREMARDVLGGNRLLGITRLRPDYEADYDGRPPVFDVCCVTEIAADDHLEDGRYNLLVRGLARVRIDRELPPSKSYREVAVSRLDDSQSTRPELLATLHEQLIAVCDRLASAMGPTGAELRELAGSASSPASCADVLAAGLVSEPDERQRLLESLDPADRLDAMLEHVSRLLLRFGSRSDMLN